MRYQKENPPNADPPKIESQKIGKADPTHMRSFQTKLKEFAYVKSQAIKADPPETEPFHQHSFNADPTSASIQMASQSRLKADPPNKTMNNAPPTPKSNFKDKLKEFIYVERDVQKADPTKHPCPGSKKFAKTSKKSVKVPKSNPMNVYESDPAKQRHLPSPIKNYSQTLEDFRFTKCSQTSQSSSKTPSSARGSKRKCDEDHSLRTPLSSATKSNNRLQTFKKKILYDDIDPTFISVSPPRSGTGTSPSQPVSPDSPANPSNPPGSCPTTPHRSRQTRPVNNLCQPPPTSAYRSRPTKSARSNPPTSRTKPRPEQVSMSRRPSSMCPSPPATGCPS